MMSHLCRQAVNSTHSPQESAPKAISMAFLDDFGFLGLTPTNKSCQGHQDKQYFGTQINTDFTNFL
jgi:hypothetical protein